MQARGQGGGGGSQEGSMDFLWGLGAIIALILIVWYFGGKNIALFLYKVKFYQIIVVEYVAGAWNALAAQVTLLPAIQLKTLQNLAARIETGTLSTQYATLQFALATVGKYIRYPVILIILILALVVYSRNVVAKFKIIFSMKRMKDIEQHYWPQITPTAELNLVKEDINKGPWAMSMSPMLFCKHHGLIKGKAPGEGPATAELNRGLAQQIFVMQLGPIWSGPQALPIYGKALLAAFAASANEDRGSATKLLHQINASAMHGKLNFTGAEELLAKHVGSKVVMRVLQRHAYVFCIFASMLELARTDGVFASSDFLWLKPLDRRLWYMLNTVGRQTAVPEIAGAFAHWLAERSWGAPLRTPMIEEAIKALELALTEIIYEPEDED